jgi:gamma-glutamyl:cysteine ligase YbdK (ATP-grasp superfamily)
MAKKLHEEAAEVVAAPKAEQAPKDVKSALQEFVMPVANTCAKCAAEIQQGEPVFAKDLNQVVAGQGLCKKCAG